ncbi:hypothetical protein K227x_60620 [Rubripirellula lacrimiformis]|uniref:Polysaccharide lyase n=1 Tax=Rubripirellula lacrimiformis TaxID=1930273 RepID=A0A517NKG3_9BACT|nr:polysaccharide lyase [Rubripirellula lacrimiformis]QDT07634.1 hypothetical protein K227x_60620 [Rubripirellula lacrimiformis]
MKNLVVLLLLAIVWAGASGCGRAGGRGEELSFLRRIMSDDLAVHASLDVPSRECLVRADSDGETCLGFRLLPGQPKLHGGVRAEVSVDFPHCEGDVVRYEWRFKLAEDFVSDSPDNRWWVIAQWHDQPDPLKNETWQNHTSLSPPISLNIGEVDGSLAIGLTYGLTRDGHQQTVSDPVAIKRNVWYRVVANVHWSQTETGMAECFLDDSPEPIFVANGPNMNNGFRHYLKLGMYRHPDIDTENTIFVDDVAIEISHPTSSAGPSQADR